MCRQPPRCYNRPDVARPPARGQRERTSFVVSDHAGRAKTAFVFAGGGSFGAIQVGMMHSLAAHGISADMVVGSSVGALNGAYYAGDPTLKGVLRLETIWRGLQRHDVFPMTWRTLLGFLWRRDFLIPHDGIRKLIDDHLPYRNLQDAKLPVHIVTTDIVSGDSVVLSEGPAARGDHRLDRDSRRLRAGPLQGFLSGRRRDLLATRRSGSRSRRAPTPDHPADGYACATHAPPAGAVANALHALTLLIARQLVSELEGLGPDDRILRGAAVMSAGGIALRFLANGRSYRARDPQHRRLAGAERLGAGRDSRRDAAA